MRPHPHSPAQPLSANAESPLLRDLTPEQRAAVTTISGPLLVIAAAGSGKTRVLTRRVAYLIEQGVLPGSILAITFTNKAAGEMRHRVSELLSAAGRPPLRDFGRLDPRQPTICTFHSLCLRILRAHGPQLSQTDLTVFDTADQLKVIKDALKALDLSSTNFPPQQVLGTISNAKNQLLTPDAYAAAASDFYRRQVARVYHKYQALLAAQNALDFDDLLMKVVLGLRDHPDVLADLHERIDYLLIDEYQDTNHAQYMLAHLLAMKRRNICVVGDPDQSIYAWRGADLRNILEFKKDYPDAVEVKLETNYRSTPTILAVADRLIKHNTQRIDKRLLTPNPDAGKVRLVLCQDEHDEADVVTAALKAAHDAGTPWGDMAVFYRMNSLSRVVEDALRRSAIPYVMARGVEFYNRKEIKDVLAYLRTIVNPLDEVSLDRVLSTPARGIGDASLQRIRVWAAQRHLSLFDAFRHVADIDGIPPRAKTALTTLVRLFDGWRDFAGVSRPTPAQPPQTPAPVPAIDSPEDMFAAFETADDAPAEPSPDSPPAPPTLPRATRPAVTAPLIERVLKESGLEAVLAKESRAAADTGNDPLANVAELISAAAEFDDNTPEGTLSDYLAQVALVSDTDALARPDSGGAVTLMTLHAAKGLEFPVVAMVGWEEGVLPHSRARGNPDELEEERRLAFVGITRAMRTLLLTKAAVRTIRGLRERTITSPFLQELPPEHIELVDRTGLPTAGLGSLRGTSAPDARHGPADTRYATVRSVLGQQFTPGTLVRHPSFGAGRILELSGTGQNTRCVVEFATHGRKTLVLEYARLEVLRPGE